MKKENYVSIWVGVTPDLSALEEYVQTTYLEEDEEEDDDMLGSSFSNDYSLGYVDDDFLELSCFDSNSNILDGMECSYYEYVSEQIKRAGKHLVADNVNFAILYFNYNYSGEVNEIRNGDIALRFLGRFLYR